MRIPEYDADRDLDDIFAHFEQQSLPTVREYACREVIFKVVENILFPRPDLEEGDRPGYKNRYAAFVREQLSDPLREWEKLLGKELGVSAPDDATRISDSVHNLLAMAYAETHDAVRARNCARRQLVKYTAASQTAVQPHNIPTAVSFFLRIDECLAHVALALSWLVERDYRQYREHILQAWKLATGCQNEEKPVAGAAWWYESIPPAPPGGGTGSFWGDETFQTAAKWWDAQHVKVILLAKLEIEMAYRALASHDLPWRARMKRAAVHIANGKTILTGHGEQEIASWLLKQIRIMEFMLQESEDERTRMAFDCVATALRETAWSALRESLDLVSAALTNYGVEIERYKSKGRNALSDEFFSLGLFRATIDYAVLDRHTQITIRLLDAIKGLYSEDDLLGWVALIARLLSTVIERLPILAERAPEDLDTLGALCFEEFARTAPASHDVLNHVHDFLTSLRDHGLRAKVPKICRVLKNWPEVPADCMERPLYDSVMQFCQEAV